MSGQLGKSAGQPYRALDMLHRQYAPHVAGREPFWRPTPPDPIAEVWAPRWQWRTPLTSQDAQGISTFDGNATYLSAMSSVEVPHGALVHTPRVRRFDSRTPGIWLVDAHPWPAWDQIMSPLGGTGADRRTDRVWVTSPTMHLLSTLVESGHWPDLTVYDAWTCPTRCRLRGWAQRMAEDRAAAMDAHDLERLAAIKLGYSQAVTVMMTPGRASIHRPDWARFVPAQGSASIWRRAWACLLAGFRLLGAWGIDELAFPTPVARALARVGSPLPYDPTGRRLGTWKVKTARLDVRGWPRAAVR